MTSTEGSVGSRFFSSPFRLTRNAPSLPSWDETPINGPCLSHFDDLFSFCYGESPSSVLRNSIHLELLERELYLCKSLRFLEISLINSRQ